MQDNLSVSNGKITGTLKYLASGKLTTDWGEGNFMALGFASSDSNIKSIRVGLRPSISNMLPELDSDMDGVFKVTDKDVQDFIVVSSDGAYKQVDVYDLSELTCQTSQGG